MILRKQTLFPHGGGKYHQVTTISELPIRVSKATDIHRWFAVAFLGMATLDFLDGFPFKFHSNTKQAVPA